MGCIVTIKGRGELCKKANRAEAKTISQSAATARSHHMALLRHIPVLLAHVWVSVAGVMLSWNLLSFGSGNSGTPPEDLARAHGLLNLLTAFTHQD
jgi:hypothetical protein